MRERLLSVLLLGAAGACTFEPGAGAAPSECRPVLYRIDAVSLPRSGTGAAQLALDLDGDGAPDNRLGRLHATLAGFFSDWRPDEHLTARVGGARPALSWIMTVERCDGAIAVDLARGTDDGAGGVTIDPGDDAAVGGVAPGGSGRAFDGTGELPLLGFTDGLGLADDAGWVPARGLAVALAAEPDAAELDATIGAGLDLTDLALEPVAGFLTRHAGSTLARALDRDGDDVITVAELRASEAVAALIARDVDVAGTDGVLDHVSIAFTVHATRLDSR